MLRYPSLLSVLDGLLREVPSSMTVQGFLARYLRNIIALYRSTRESNCAFEKPFCDSGQSHTVVDADVRHDRSVSNLRIGMFDTVRRQCLLESIRCSPVAERQRVFKRIFTASLPKTATGT